MKWYYKFRYWLHSKGFCWYDFELADKPFIKAKQQCRICGKKQVLSKFAKDVYIWRDIE